MGCPSSKNVVSTVPSKKLSVDPVKPLSIEKTISHLTRILENCLIIWYHNETSNKYESEKEQLRKLVYGLKIFNNIDACVDFITNIQDEKVFLIISSSRRTIERFHCLSQIERIYIFDSSSPSSSHELSDEKHGTLKYDIIRDIDSLYKQLQLDIKLCEMDLILVTSAPVLSQESLLLSNLTKQETSFLFAQMIKEIINRLKFESGSKDVFIDFCRTNYINNNEQLYIIDEFAKNYRPNKALWYLTHECFISHILNRIHRTREIDIIYKLGFFIKHTYIQLNHLHDKNISLIEKIAVVYRGKTMSCKDFDTLVKNNVGGLLSFPNFLIATINKEIANDFVSRRHMIHPDMTRIIFEIHIDHTMFNEKNPFTLLKDIDMNENEICFYMSTVFRIESIEQTTNDATVTWFVKLKLVNDNDSQLHRFITFVRSDELHANPVSYLGKLLIDMGEYRRAEQFFHGLSQDPSVRSQPRRLVRAHNGLGALYAYKGEYTKALEHYQESLETSLIYLQSDHPDLAPIYKVIGDTYMNQSNHIHAIENYEKAIELLQRDIQQVNSEIIVDLQTSLNKAKELIQSSK